VRRTRVVEVMAAMSLVTDLASGLPFEKGLQVCLVADTLGAALDLKADQRLALFEAALLRSIGCTARAPENSALFVDDTAFQAALKRLDPADPQRFASQLEDFGAWAGESAAAGDLAGRFVEVAPTEGPVAATAGCEVSQALAPGLGASAAAVRALDDVYERWDGLGIPLGRAGGEIALVARVLHAAEQLVLARADPRVADPVTDVRGRAGGHLDPAVVDVLAASATAVLSPLDAPDLLDAVLGREPVPLRHVDGPGLTAMCGVLGQVADLKSTHLLGHSRHVADLAGSAGPRAGLDEQQVDDLRCAALLHNLGSVVVPSAELDGRLSAAGRERLALHTHWTRRILGRCPSLAHLAPVVAPASAHHIAYAEGGHRHWHRGGELPAPGSNPVADVLEAAEAWASATEPRPGRPPARPAEAAAAVEAAVRDGRLDRTAATAVLEAAGHARRAPDPGPLLTPREVEVLRLAARGLSNREIAAELSISDRTVGHHLAHVYDKTGHRTRAGVAVWAVERRLLP
jgi:HD-GYP domain-containing protein (c-di-GMP phosphodiesterase class II)